MLYVEKRNGVVMPFDKQRIINAINKAFVSVDGQLYNDEIAKEIAEDVEETVYGVNNHGCNTHVEDIQDLIEEALMESNRHDVAREYVRYRYKREVARKSEDTFFKEIAKKLQARDVENSNANMDERSFGGRLGSASDVMMKRYALDYCMSKKSRENHENNEIYIHDLNSYALGSHNCLSVPFDDLLAKGFNTRQIDVRPAQSVNTAFQLIAVVFQLQSLMQFGGVSATHLDWTMVPYVRKSFYKHFKDGLKYVQHIDQEWGLQELTNESSIIDPQYKRSESAYQYAMDMTVRETKQAVEGMYHNLNTLQSRSGNQLPFSSINYGTCTLEEGRMVTKALLEVSIEGLGKLHRTSIFPCGIFQCMKGINRAPGDPNYDLFKLALRSTAQRLYPNYANCNWSGNQGYNPNDPCTFFSTMGCRTANSWDINGLGQRKDGRGNICPVTIILPTIAMKALQEAMNCEYVMKGDCLVTDYNSEDPYCANQAAVDVAHKLVDGRRKIAIHEFMNLLDQKIHEAKDMLLERFEYICAQPAESAKFMYENGLMAGYDGKTTRSALRHGTLALGQLGLAETLQILIGKDHTTPEGMELAKRIEQLFKDRCAEFKEQYKLNFGVYYSPAESLCYTAMTKFKDKYGVIPNVSDRNYFTNSMHVPVWKKISIFDKINIESQLTGYSSAGCITYIELDSGAKNNLEALEQIVNFAMDKDIPYFAVNVPVDTCLDCGYTDEFNDHCPECGSHNIQQLRRVTGYLTGDYKSAFNHGKVCETEDRIKHGSR